MFKWSNSSTPCRSGFVIAYVDFVCYSKIILLQFVLDQVRESSVIPARNRIIDRIRLATYLFSVLWTSYEVSFVSRIAKSNANIE